MLEAKPGKGDDLGAFLQAGRDLAAKALERPHVRPMDMTGTRMKSVVLVSAAGLEDDEALQAWVDEAVAFVGTLPPKKRRRR